jgi:aspartyl-tRNA(Asn)/glutamyl-tRNA(Gln) amidotransferase subunit A
MNQLLNKTIKEISQLLCEKKVSSLELTKEVFSHIKKIEPKIKAFITLTEKEALKQAEASDKRRSKNQELSPIDGIPISIKDILCTKDIKTTAGSNMLGDFVPPYDATVVKRLKDSGAVIIGKNNLDAWAHGSSTENSDFFTSHNPWDLDRVPGGSSGGSAAAVASGMGFASFGTDTGGSIRQPAALCGVTGLKPTYGRNSRYGLIAMASSLDCPGIFARSTEDVATLLEIICGQDPLDSTTVPGKKFDAKAVSRQPSAVSKMRIGIPKEYFSEGLDPKVKEKIFEAVEVYKKMGATIKEITLPNTDYALAVYYIIQPAEVSSNLARFDGIKYGFSVEKQVESKKLKVESLIDVYMKSRAYGFGDEAKRRIMIGTYVLSSGYYDAYYKKAMKVRTLVCDDFMRAFKDVDVIITPTTPTTAFKIGEKSKDPLEMYMSDIYTVSANIAGIPGVSIPCGFIESQQLSAISHQLPVGMQILGPQFSEELILGLANAYQQKTEWHKEIPGL